MVPPTGAAPIEWPGVLAMQAGDSVHVGLSPAASSAGHRCLAPQSWLGAGQGAEAEPDECSCKERGFCPRCTGPPQPQALWQLLSSCLCCPTVGHPWVAAEPRPCAPGCRAVPLSVLEAGGACSHLVFPSSVLAHQPILLICGCRGAAGPVRTMRTARVLWWVGSPPRARPSPWRSWAPAEGAASRTGAVYGSRSSIFILIFLWLELYI